MGWEEYLAEAVGEIADKYQARRYKAHLRAQLLERYQSHFAKGATKESAMELAMADMGDAKHVAMRVARPLSHQRGWLWLLSVAQLIVGLSIVAFSLKTESFAALALGRVMALWGVVTTGFQARRGRRFRAGFHLLQLRLRYAHRSLLLRDFWRMVAAGFVTGVLMALVASLPWNVVNANMFHPVVLSTGGSMILSGLAVVVPWTRLRRWVGQSFYLVTMQAWAALGGALGATVVILWNQGFAPPPLFNWQPELLFVGAWVFQFMLLRFVAALTTLRERVLVGWDHDRFTSF